MMSIKKAVRDSNSKTKYRHLQTDNFSSTEIELPQEIKNVDPDIILNEFPNIFPGLNSKSVINFLKTHFSKDCTSLEKTAANIHNHQLNIFSTKLVDLGNVIDWNYDYINNKQWVKKHYTIQQLINIGNDYDIKFAWELSRFHHLVPLAIAFTLNDDPAYPREFETEINSWISQNKYQQSINWTNPMEVSIRIINWLLAYKIFSAKWNFDKEFKSKLVGEFFKAAKFIDSHHEYLGYASNSNHYIANLLGLSFLGQLFKNSEAGLKWLETSQQLDKEIVFITDANGFCKESSLSYHGLVTEILLYYYLLGIESGFKISDDFPVILTKMLENLKIFSSDNGVILPIGDNTDSRLVKLFNRHPYSFNDTLAIGERLLSNSQGKDEIHYPEELLLLRDSEGLKIVNKKHNKPFSLCLQESGIAKLCSNDLSLTFFANKIGSSGKGTHKHNDLLSFTLDYKGKPIFVDPGTYSYTSNEKMRNYFRSTKAHNTIMIDSEEQNRMLQGMPFVLRHDSNPHLNLWKSTPNSDIVSATTDSYQRLSDPVMLKRSIFLHKKSQVILIRDAITGKEKHNCKFFFQLADVKITILQEGIFKIECLNSQESLIFSCLKPDSPLGIETNWISPSYGVKYPGLKLCLDIDLDLPSEVLFAITPTDSNDVVESMRRIHSAREAYNW